MLARYAAHRTSLWGNPAHQVLNAQRARLFGAGRRFNTLSHTSKIRRIPSSSILARRFSNPEPELSGLDKLIDFARVFLQKRAMFYVGVGGVTLLVLLYFYYEESEECIIREMRSVFESGGCIPNDSAPALVKRPELLTSLQLLLRPKESDHLYYVITGDEGAGKSTAIRSAIRTLHLPKAVVYCEVGSSQTFVKDLAKAVGYRPSFDLRARVWRMIQGAGFWPGELTWEELLSKLDAVSEITPNPLVVVLDSADRLFEEDRKFFSKLQRDAKAKADHGSIVFVFVLTKGRGLKFLRSHSEWSRAADPFEVRDISDDEAKKLLLAKHALKPEEAEEVVRTITGGRFHLLYSFRASKPIEQYRSELFTKTNAALVNCSLRPAHPFFARLSSSVSKCIPADVAEELLGDTQLSKLVEKKVLSIRADGSYAFNSRHVEAFFAELDLKTADDPFALLPETATMEEVLRMVAKEQSYTEEEVQHDLASLHGKRVRTVGNLRVLSKEDIKELGLPPVVTRYLFHVKG